MDATRPKSENDFDELQAEGELERSETLVRLAFTVLFAVILSIVETLIGVLVIFQLIYSLVTRRDPTLRVRELANSAISYYYQVLRYVTHNESRLPFPFSDFPEPLEATGEPRAENESQADDPSEEASE
jgi:hypothetical protein